jgi:transposase
LRHKRLEKGVFHFPSAGTTHVELDAADLLLLLDGIDLTHATRRPRWRPRLAAGR